MLPSGTEARRAALELKLSQARDALQGAQGGDEAAAGRALAILLRTAGEDEQALGEALKAPSAERLPSTVMTLTDRGLHEFEIGTKSRASARLELLPPCDDYEILSIAGTCQTKEGLPRKIVVSFQNGTRLAETTIFMAGPMPGEMATLWSNLSCGPLVLKEARGLAIDVFGQPADIFSFNVVGGKPRAGRQ